MIASRNVNDLSPRMRALYVRFDNAMRAAGIDYIVTCTFRDGEEQDRLYAQGRTTQGKIVTNARAGQSKHNDVNAENKPASEAFDIVIMNGGKPDWDVRNPNWKIAGKIGKNVGLEWAGDWKKFTEYPHFQLPEGK